MNFSWPSKTQSLSCQELSTTSPWEDLELKFCDCERIPLLNTPFFNEARRSEAEDLEVFEAKHSSRGQCLTSLKLFDRNL